MPIYRHYIAKMLAAVKQLSHMMSLLSDMSCLPSMENRNLLSIDQMLFSITLVASSFNYYPLYNSLCKLCVSYPYLD